jgi:hypothetical protein
MTACRRGRVGSVWAMPRFIHGPVACRHPAGG